VEESAFLLGEGPEIGSLEFGKGAASAAPPLILKRRTARLEAVPFQSSIACQGRIHQPIIPIRDYYSCVRC